MSKFLIADPVHIHTRNFGSLFDYLHDAKATVIVNNEYREWMSAFGDYTPFQDKLTEHYNLLKDMTSSQLFEYSVFQINAFKVARAEILSLAITSEDLRDQTLPSDLKTLLTLLLSSHRDLVLWNMAAAIHWINYWATILKRHNPKFVLVFSGSLVYARALLEFTRTHTARPFVLESFFTGNDNYTEEKYEPIANNSNLKYQAYYKSLEPKISADERDRERNKALNKVVSAKNKNVSQPKETNVKLFKNGKPTLLITGQVLNDFSVLEYNGTGMNTIAFYSKLIDKLLRKTDFNIIFKSHPWEQKKKNITSALTLETLCRKYDATPYIAAANDRLILIEDFNIKSLFKQVDYISGINSQALLEAAFEGYQPIQFGNAFYGDKGFTSDYRTDQIDDFIEDLLAGKVPSRLGITEYRQYETFLLRTLQRSLVSAFPSGKAQLKSIFQLPSHVSLVKPTVPGAVVEKPAPAKPAAAPKPAPAKPAATKPQPAKPAAPAAPAPAVKAPAAAAAPAVKPAPAPAPAPQMIPATLGEVAEKAEKSKKKWEKFRRTPKKFFSDSKNKRIHWMHIFFPKRMSFSRKK
ncbi:capsular biosynthesis protein CpsB [Pseudomonas kielensis]|uniref:capsular polysaccharide export protein, LipB/KpsS family n=1 Tax=Pseudomonas kielensis TaxID=2762577 RepID=UPI00265E1A6D|nr:capsular biosynthesis protein CpsB [Pseudomonas kielensis]WKL51676.1 capsular biosynthesis protein CpsB [Pseudomonas kielensis]